MDAWICVIAEALETQRCQICTDIWAQLLSAGQWEQRLKNNPAVAGAHVCLCVFLIRMSIAGCKYQFLLLSEQLLENNTSYNITHAFGEMVKNSYLSAHSIVMLGY